MCLSPTYFAPDQDVDEDSIEELSSVYFKLQFSTRYFLVLLGGSPSAFCDRMNLVGGGGVISARMILNSGMENYSLKGIFDKGAP